MRGVVADGKMREYLWFETLLRVWKRKIDFRNGMMVVKYSVKVFFLILCI